MDYMIKLSRPVKKIKVTFGKDEEITDVVPINKYQLSLNKWQPVNAFHTNRWVEMWCPTGVVYGIQNYTKKDGYVRCTYNNQDIGKVEVPKTNSMADSIKAGLDFCQKHYDKMFNRMLTGEVPPYISEMDNPDEGEK